MDFKITQIFHQELINNIYFDIRKNNKEYGYWDIKNGKTIINIYYTNILIQLDNIILPDEKNIDKQLERIMLLK